MPHDDADERTEPTPTPLLYRSKGDASDPLPPGAGWVYLTERGEWLVDLNAAQRRAEEQAAEVRRCAAPDWPGTLPPQVRKEGPWAVTLFDGTMLVSHSQFYVQSQVPPGEPVGEHDIPDHFTGQRNGLCGGAVPGRLCLLTATHTGQVPLKVELHPAAPPLDDAWEDVVELSFQVEPWRVSLISLFSDQWVPLPLPRGQYRLRCSAADMRGEWEADPSVGRERYLWQFWPVAAHEADRIVKVGSAYARHQHTAYGGRAGAVVAGPTLQQGEGDQLPEGVPARRLAAVDPQRTMQREAEQDEEREARLARPWPGDLPPVVGTRGPWRVNLFDGRPRVSHHQIHFEPMEVEEGDGMLPMPLENFNGQRNGLCGTALPDRMCLMTARHTGEVTLRIDLLSEAPPIDEGWEDIVEASFQVVHGRVLLAPLLSDTSWPLDVPLGCYRVRCLASGRRDDAVRTPEDPAESILMQWWREPAPRADQILKAGSDSAREAHARLVGCGA